MSMLLDTKNWLFAKTLICLPFSPNSSTYFSFPTPLTRFFKKKTGPFVSIFKIFTQIGDHLSSSKVKHENRNAIVKTLMECCHKFTKEILRGS